MAKFQVGQRVDGLVVGRFIVENIRHVSNLVILDLREIGPCGELARRLVSLPEEAVKDAEPKALHHASGLVVFDN